jgi:CheY-like chemotaxis protein
MMSLPSLRILVVDDQEDMRTLVVCLLESAGAKARSFESADQALETFVKWRPDLIVADIMMPKHDGYWLLRHIRQLEPEQGRETPAIALTCLTSDEDCARALSAGFQIHMGKETMFDNLVSAVRALTGCATFDR